MGGFGTGGEKEGEVAGSTTEEGKEKEIVGTRREGDELGSQLTGRAGQY